MKTNIVPSKANHSVSKSNTTLLVISGICVLLGVCFYLISIPIAELFVGEIGKMFLLLGTMIYCSGLIKHEENRLTKELLYVGATISCLGVIIFLIRALAFII